MIVGRGCIAGMGCIGGATPGWLILPTPGGMASAGGACEPTVVPNRAGNPGFVTDDALIPGVVPNGAGLAALGFGALLCAEDEAGRPAQREFAAAPLAVPCARAICTLSKTVMQKGIKR